MLNHILNKRSDIQAWYCPTIFWPAVNELKRPVLICSPDVVFNHFPIGFAYLIPYGMPLYETIAKTIKTGKYFTTYSEDVKQNTLVDKHGVTPENVFVIRHGANNLDLLIDPQSRSVSVSLLEDALKTARNGYYSKRYFNAKEMRFLFYASQERPNKNILTLLKAYHHLLQYRDFQHKLVLTATTEYHPHLASFIRDNHLEDEVLFLHRITAKQLAACYHLAELSVNPTFSEGGFPFTFTESLSVGTPLIMSRINVTEEIITDPELNDMMLFDPYNWKEMADKIEWALENKDLLLSKQMPLYQELKNRTWKDVVQDYVKVLDHISETGERE